MGRQELPVLVERNEAMSNPDDRHYARLDPQPIDVIEAWGMTDDHYRATAFYYVARAPYKGSYSTDCIKAAWYLLRAAGWKLDMDAGSVTEMRGDAVEPESEAAPLKDGLPAGLRWAQDDSRHPHFIASIGGTGLLFLSRDDIAVGSLCSRPDADKLIAMLRRKNGLA